MQPSASEIAFGGTHWLWHDDMTVYPSISVLFVKWFQMTLLDEQQERHPERHLTGKNTAPVIHKGSFGEGNSLSWSNPRKGGWFKQKLEIVPVVALVMVIMQ